MRYYNGYNIELHYDRESWVIVESVSAKKEFEDGSWDIIFGYFEHEVIDQIQNRTDDDIIMNHYNVISRKSESYVEESLQYYQKGNIQQAINVLNQNFDKIQSKRWTESLIKHLNRLKTI